MRPAAEIGLGELERIGAWTIARPRPERDRYGRWHRDPGGQWDWFYGLEPAERDYVRARHMSELGPGPDEVATRLGLEIDPAMEHWLETVRLTRSRHLALADPLDDDYGDPSPDDDELMGPDEVAAYLQVKRNTIAQWRHRRILPAPDFILSGMPVWRRGDIASWARNTGRELEQDAAGF